jgi:hypothetical protein
MILHHTLDLVWCLGIYCKDILNSLKISSPSIHFFLDRWIKLM